MNLQPIVPFRFLSARGYNVRTSTNNGKPAVNAERHYQVVTANRVRDGLSIYLTESGDWSTSVCEALCLVDPVDALARAEADRLRAIAPYVIEVEAKDGGLCPVGLREKIRAFGPTA